MIFYQGKGYLVYLVPIVVIILGAFVFEKGNWWFYSGLITAALELGVAYVSYKEHKGNPYKYLDKQTGEIVFVEHKNTVYWIKAEYWAIFIAFVLTMSAVLT
jgi:positive regulator of sigma E activity